MYEFKKIKKKFVWKGPEYSIEFYDPTIETVNSYERINNINDSLYYYYTMQICRYNDKGVKRIIHRVYAYDFPNITYMKDILEEVINAQPDDNWQTSGFGNGYEIRNYVSSLHGIFNDDYLCLNKSIRNRNIHYDMFIGGGTTPTRGNHVCVHLSDINEEDLNRLIECINAFMEYSIEKTNKEKEKFFKLSSRACEIIYGKLYVHEKYNKGRRKISDYFNEMYICGDFLEDLDIVVGDSYAELGNCIIKEIKKDYIVVQMEEDKTLEPCENVVLKGMIDVPIKNILYISNTLEDDSIFDDISAIASKFVSILSPEEKKFFSNGAIEDIIHQYGRVLIGRYHMCRKEHPYQKEKQLYFEDVMSLIIPQTIKEIRKML